MSATLGPMDTVIANKFIKTLAVADELHNGNAPAQGHKQKGGIPPSDIFKTATELMYGGQGKMMSNENLMPITEK